MRLILASPGRFGRLGENWAARALGYERLYRRYLAEFEQVEVLAQVCAIEDPTTAPVAGPGVTVTALPPMMGWRAVLGPLQELRRRVRAACDPEAAYLLRAPGPVADVTWRELMARGQPYALEMPGDPWLSLAPGNSRRLLRPVLRRHRLRILREQARHACAVGYFSHEQARRYPAGPGAHQTFVNDANLSAEAIVAAPRTFVPGGRRRVICVGTLRRARKSPEAVIDAVASCVADGLDLELVWVGGGELLEPMRARARSAGLGERAHFTGQLPAGAAVLEQLDAADIFVLVSRAEGMPNALLEAMARGLPCIGSAVGGIPDLLAPEDLVPMGDVRVTARLLAQVATDERRMNEMSRRNLATVQDHSAASTQARREALCVQLRVSTEAWLAGRAERE